MSSSSSKLSYKVGRDSALELPRVTHIRDEELPPGTLATPLDLPPVAGASESDEGRQPTEEAIEMVDRVFRWADESR